MTCMGPTAMIMTTILVSMIGIESLLLATLLCRPSWNLTKRTAMDPSKPGEMIDISNTKNEVTPSNCIRNVLSQTLITLG